MSGDKIERDKPQDRNPNAPQDESRQAGCGDQGCSSCGNSEEKNPLPSKIPTSLAVRGASNEKKGKRKARDTETPEPPPLTTSESSRDKSKSRTRLTRGQKIEILQLLRRDVQYKEIARRYTCSERTIYSIAEKRETLEKEAQSAGYDDSAKSLRPAAIPKLEKDVASLVEEARKRNIPVNRETLISFAHIVKSCMLSSDRIAPDVKAKLESFGASHKWVKNFVKRQRLTTKVLHGEASSVDPEVIRKAMEEIRAAYKEYQSNDNVMEENGPKSPSHGELLMYFNLLEKFAKSSGNADALHHLQRARISFSTTLGAKRARRKDPT